MQGPGSFGQFQFFVICVSATAIEITPTSGALCVVPGSFLCLLRRVQRACVILHLGRLILSDHVQVWKLPQSFVNLVDSNRGVVMTFLQHLDQDGNIEPTVRKARFL